MCLFPDTQIYWGLRSDDPHGGALRISWNGATSPISPCARPGIPLFLAACQALFGERTLAVRLVQAVLGTAERLPGVPADPADRGAWRSTAARPGPASPRCWTVPLVAAALAALNPYYIFMSALILSEAVFVPLMLACSGAWRCSGSSPVGRTRLADWTAVLVALGSGAAAGAAILVRPSWALFRAGGPGDLGDCEAARSPRPGRGGCAMR